MRAWTAALLIILLATWGHADDIRTWTSVSGAKVEARYAGLEHGSIVLESPDGLTFKIPPNQLSEADQQYVRDVETPAAPAPQAAPEPSRRWGARAARPPPPSTGEPPPTLDSRSIQGLNLVAPDAVRILGIQYGPRAQDVVYVIADRSTATSEIFDVLYLFNPLVTGPQRLQKLKSQSRRLEQDRYFRFEQQTFTAQHGATRAEHKVTFESGAIRSDLVWITVESRFTTGQQVVDVHFKGSLNNEARIGHGDIPVMSLTLPFEGSLLLNTYRPGNNMFGSISAKREFVVTGPPALLNAIVMEARDAAGTVVETHQVAIRPSPEFPEAMRQVYSATFQRLTQGEQYTIVVRADLGPVLGAVERTMSLRAR